MKKISVTVPYCPQSVNSYWVRNRNGSVRVSERGREFKQNVASFIFFECDIGEKPYFTTDDIKVNLVLNFKTNRRRDIDNYCKGIFDSLTGILWADDSQISKLNIELHRGTKKADNFVLEIWEDGIK